MDVVQYISHRKHTPNCSHYNHSVGYITTKRALSRGKRSD